MLDSKRASPVAPFVDRKEIYAVVNQIVLMSSMYEWFDILGFIREEFPHYLKQFENALLLKQ